MARRELARAYLGAAQCRLARTGRRPCPIPARPRRARAMARTLCLEDGVGMIGGCCGTDVAHIAALDAMLRRIGRVEMGAGGRRRARRRPAWTPVRRLALRPGGVAPGECLAVDRRALQRQRLAQIPPAAGAGRLGRLRRDGPRAGQGRLAHARSVHRLCRARRGRRHDRRRSPACAARSTRRWSSIRPNTRCSKRRSSSMAASRSSTRSISRMARRRPTSGWSWPAALAPRSSP